MTLDTGNLLYDSGAQERAGHVIYKAMRMDER